MGIRRLLVAASFLLSNAALADQFCFELYFKSDYENCPFDTTGMKWIPGCTSFFVAPNRTPRNLVVELWDKDTTNADDFIGEYVLPYTSESSQGVCLNFSWDPVARGEAAPDVYIRTDFQVRGSTFAPYFSQACEVDNAPNDSCPDEVKETWRSYAVTDCTNCTSSSVLLFDSDPAGYFNRTAMIMHSAAQWEDLFDSSNLRNANAWFFIDGQECSGACVYDDRQWVSMPFTSVRRWDTPTHELGHIWHKQALNEDNLPGLQCPTHYIDQPSNERCATTEGYAHYIHAVSWWSPSNTGSRPTKSGASIEGGPNPTSTSCDVNSEIEIEVARTFWDYDDANNEGSSNLPGVGADPFNGTTAALSQAWRDFPRGTGNNQSQEDLPLRPENALNLNDFRLNMDDVNFDAMMVHNGTTCYQTN